MSQEKNDLAETERLMRVQDILMDRDIRSSRIDADLRRINWSEPDPVKDQFKMIWSGATVFFAIAVVALLLVACGVLFGVIPS